MTRGGRALRVYATCDLGPALERIPSAGLELEVHPGPEAPPYATLRAAARDADGLVTTLRDQVDEGLLEDAPRLQVIAQCAVGLDNVDLFAAKARGVVVTHTPDVLTGATAEFAVFMLGALARRLWSSEVEVREHLWDGWHPFLPFLGREVSGLTIGVLGLGRIGRAFAARCVGLETDLLLCGSRPAPDLVAALQAEMDLRHERGLCGRRHTARAVDLDTLLTTSDALSLHVPLRPSTHHLIDAESLARMKPGALLVNASRGPVVDEVALVESLRAGHLGGAALDVYATEPLPADSPLRDPALADRLRLYHHFASGTERTRLDPDPDLGMAGRCVAGLLAVLRPDQPLSDLDYVLSP